MLHDAKISYPAPKPTDTMVLSTEDGAEPVIITLDPVPNKLGSQEIVRPDALTAVPKCIKPGAAFSLTYLLQQAGISQTLQKMNDGAYYMAISDIIVDPTGQPVYYSLIFPQNHQEATTDANGFNTVKPSGLTKQDEQEIQKKLSAVFLGGDISFTPGTNKQGTKTPYFLDPYGKDSDLQLHTTVVVKNHKISFQAQVN